MREVEISKVARVARIFLTESEALKYQSNLDTIIPWFRDMLSIEIPPNTIPVYSITANTEGENFFEDEPKKLDTMEEVLFNVPNKKENLILVPKVI
jgi:aspartyl/glutamyl-tRNA(Asn/Gln) amidotransferase C subunit